MWTDAQACFSYLGKKEMKGREGSVLLQVPCAGQANDMARVIFRPLGPPLSPLFRIAPSQKCDLPSPKADGYWGCR